MNQKVDLYLSKLSSPQKEICEYLRKLIFRIFPKVEESYKNGVPWYEDKFYIVGLRDSVNLGFSVYKLPKSDLEKFSGKGKYMRHLKFKSLDEIDEEKVIKLLELVEGKFMPCH